jgi:hypothetical protein
MRLPTCFWPPLLGRAADSDRTTTWSTSMYRETHKWRIGHGPTGLVTPPNRAPHEVADEGRPEDMERVPAESTWTLWHRWRPFRASARCRISGHCLGPQGAVRV